MIIGLFGPVDSVDPMDLWILWTYGLYGPVDSLVLWICGLFGPVDSLDLWTLWTCEPMDSVDSVDLCTLGNGLTHELNYCLVSYFVWFIGF